MKRRRATGWAVLVAVVTLGAVACGGGGLSDEEFTQEANAICERHRGTIEEAASQVLAGGQLPDPQELGELTQETIVPELEAQFSELGELEPPDDVAGAFQDYLAEGERAVQDLQQDPSVITDPANFQDLNRRADEAGLSDACHVGPG